MPGKPAPMPLPSQPSMIDAHLLHADRCVESGQLAPALGLYRTAAAVAEGQGDFTRALSIQIRISRLDPDPSVRYHIGELLRQSGQSSQAADVFEGVLRDEARAHRWGHALVAARAAYEADPTATRRWQLGELLAHHGHADEAVEHLHACAAVELEHNRLRRFHTLARRIIGLAPQHVPTLRLMLDAFLRAGDVHRCVAVIRSLRAVAPEDRAVFEGAAEAFLLLGKAERAAEILQLFALRQPESAVPPPATRRLAVQAPAALRDVTRVLDVSDLMDVGPRGHGLPPLPQFVRA